MDWIDEQIMKIQDKVRNLSLLKGALVYLAFFFGNSYDLNYFDQPDQ